MQTKPPSAAAANSPAPPVVLPLSPLLPHSYCHPAVVRADPKASAPAADGPAHEDAVIDNLIGRLRGTLEGLPKGTQASGDALRRPARGRERGGVAWGATAACVHERGCALCAAHAWAAPNGRDLVPAALRCLCVAPSRPQTACPPSRAPSPSCLQLSPVSFEKDDDSNYHMQVGAPPASLVPPAAMARCVLPAAALAACGTTNTDYTPTARRTPTPLLNLHSPTAVTPAPASPTRSSSPASPTCGPATTPSQRWTSCRWVGLVYVFLVFLFWCIRGAGRGEAGRGWCAPHPVGPVPPCEPPVHLQALRQPTKRCWVPPPRPS